MLDPRDEALNAWEQRLRAAEDDLRQREQEALSRELSQDELLAFAAEHDKIALDRDNLAEAYDERALDRDRAGLGRDVTGSERDRAARAIAADRDPGFPDRAFAGGDRDYAAGDRTDSYVDRSRARRARETSSFDRGRAADERDRAAEKSGDQDQELEGLRVALETRLVIGQAQGMLMERHQVTSEAAFAILTRLSQHSNTKLRDIAAHIVATVGPDVEPGA